MTLFLRYAAKSDPGMVRKANEDSGFAGRTLLAVADGMGGHAAGELASSTAIATLAELDSEDVPTQDLLTALDDAIVTAAERIAQFVEADSSRAGMGTTLTAIMWREGRIAVIHVGDSRGYLLRDGELSQITHDHTYVQSLIDAGRITAEEARRHPKRNLILRAIDGSALPEGETSMREAQAGDRYLLCSDGLSGVVEDAAIARVLTEVPDPTAAVSALVDLALEAGAPDNVTAVVADVLEADDAEVAQESALVHPVVVGAAGEPRIRAALPGLAFPDDVGPDGQAVAAVPTGPAVAGGLAARANRPGDGGVEPTAAPTPGPPVHPGAAPSSVETEAGTPAAESPGGDGSAAEWDDATAAAPDAAAEDARPPGFVRRHLGWLVAAAIALAVVAVGITGFVWWLGSQWYVGAQNGYVTVYQGVPQTLVGIPLSRVTTQTGLAVGTLPYYDQQQLDHTIEAATEADAARIVADLELKAAACSADPAPLGCPLAILPGPTVPQASPSPSGAIANARTGATGTSAGQLGQLGASLASASSAP